jgi:hypothetical protein
MPLAEGFSAYSAQLDWPPRLRGIVGARLLPFANLGLLLRWRAALAEIVEFLSCRVDLRDAIFAQFHDSVTQAVAQNTRLDLLPGQAEADSWGGSIFCIAMRHEDGRRFDMEAAAAVQTRLREGHSAGKRFHLGQPVAVGGAGALRVSASAPLVSRVAAGVDGGLTLAAAFAPVAEDLRDLFAAWPDAMGPSPLTGSGA